MERSKFADVDTSDDQLPPRRVLEQLRAHDEAMRREKEDWGLAKAIYDTRYWEWVRGTKQREFATVEVEVNRLHGAVAAYVNALYPKANRVLLGPDPAGQGDPEKAMLAANRWLSTHRTHQRVLMAIRQGRLFPGCAAKVGYDAGRGNPLDRVWVRILPWWELLLDRDVRDWEDERFRGHVYYRPVREVEAEYDLTDLKGTHRHDFLRQPAENQQPQKITPDQPTLAPADAQGFVRVLEIDNLVDAFTDAHGNGYPGRKEIYVLGQGEESKCPVYMGPLPFAQAGGKPLPTIEPLIFEHEPDYPLRGISPVAKLLPQQRELNVFRTFVAQSARKDTRQYLVRKGLSAELLTKLSAGVDGLILEAPDDLQGPLADVVHLIPTGPISANVLQWAAQAEADFNRNLGASPNARGEITDATAFEVQTTQLYTESEFGLHASIKDEWLGRVVTLALRALVTAMQDDGDSDGAYEGRAIEMAATEARPDEGGETPKDEAEEEAEPPAQAVAAAMAEATGGPAPYVDATVERPTVGPTSGTAHQQVLHLRDRDQTVAVAVADLDADFEVGFAEGGRTPITDAAMQQNLVALMQPYLALWEKAKAGDAAAFAYMKAMAERFDFPKDLHPERLMEKAKSEAKSEAKPPAPPPDAAAPQDVHAVLGRVAQMQPDDGLKVLATLTQDNPPMAELVKRAAALPPEQRAAAMGEILNRMGAGPAATPNATGPAMEAMA